jgi:hypothetical protein
MKRLGLAALLSTPAFAQQMISPEIHADNRATFRVRAPNARDVQLRCEGVRNSAMQKDDRRLCKRHSR